MNYYPIVKFIARNAETRKSAQITLHNIKLSKNETEIDAKIRECLEIDGYNIDSTYCGLFKAPKAQDG
jgi:hypothetical protein